jgi:hypothetical protein
MLTPLNASGVAVDGVPDAEVGETFVDWNLVRTDAGGLALFYEVPPSASYAEKRFFYRDDLAHDDTVPTKSSSEYFDEDDAAYGNHGLRLIDMGDSNLTAFPITLYGYPLCGDTGDAALAGSYQERVANPPASTVIPQAACSAIRSLVAERDGDDVVLRWEAIPEADAYAVYRADFAELPHDVWSWLTETTELEYRDPGAALGGTGYYSVVCSRAGGEGPW